MVRLERIRAARNARHARRLLAVSDRSPGPGDRYVAQTIPPNQEGGEGQHEAIPIEPTQGGSTRDMLQDRAGIIVLREDLDFYAIPPKREIDQPEMLDVKRAAGRALLKQDGIFSGLRKSEEPGTTEQHLIEMLTAGYDYTLELHLQITDNETEDSIVMTNGVTELVNPTKQSFAALLWQG